MADLTRRFGVVALVALLAACGGGSGGAPDTAADPNDRFGSVDIVAPGASDAADAADDGPIAEATPEIIEAPAPPLAVCTVPSPLVSVQSERIAVSAYTIGHERQRDWARSIRRQFTDSGWQDFRDEMDKGETLRNLRRNKINMRAEADGRPTLKSSDVTTSNCVHHLIVPLRLTFEQVNNPDIETRQVGSEQQVEVSLIEVERRDGGGRVLLVDRMKPLRQGIIVDPFDMDGGAGAQ
ncbi:MAG: hypothetical protein Alpg2KO_34260 [Alphaproteobacteria bacterium]